MPVTHTHHDLDADLTVALERGLAAPLRALEAALGSLSRDLGEGCLDAPRAALARARREAEAAVELFACRPLSDDPCTVRELATSARAALPAAERARVWIATEPGGAPLCLDAPAFSRALAALIARAIATSGGEVLVHGHQEAGETVFAVVDDLGANGDPLAAPRHTQPTPELLLAHADLDRLGAEVREQAAGPHRCTTIRLVATR